MSVSSTPVTSAYKLGAISMQDSCMDTAAQLVKGNRPHLKSSPGPSSSTRGLLDRPHPHRALSPEVVGNCHGFKHFKLKGRLQLMEVPE